LADLEIRNLHVSAEGKEILKGLDLEVSKGTVQALMGPNGSGKSTLANAIMGHPALDVTDGEIRFAGEDITEAAPEDRARAGLFMAFQYPVAVPGVTVAKYLRMIINARREAQGEKHISLKDFRREAEAAMERMNVPREFSSWPFCGLAWRSWTRPTRVSTSTPSGPWPTASTPWPAPTWAS
jgi:Fe-S cluster assembly ATP-binding protein